MHDVPGKERERGSISMENCNQLAIRVLAVYFHSDDKKLTSAGTNDKIDRLLSPFTTTKKRKTGYIVERAKFHMRFLKLTKEVRNEQSWLGFRLEI